jgi:flagellar assembly protein FliH
MSIVIPKEQAQTFERWQMTSFDRPLNAPTSQPKPLVAPPPPRTEKIARPVVTEEDIETDLSKVEFKLPTAEDIEKIHDEAKAEGYQAGFEEGKRLAHSEGLQAIESQTQRLTEIVSHLSASLNDLDQELAEDVLEFAIEVARQVVSASLKVSTESLLPIIREAMSALPLHHSAVVIHVNHHDVDMVRHHFGEQLQHAGWRIMEDPDIQAGGCKLHAGSSEVDATIGTRWRRTIEAMGAKPDWLEPGP